MSTITLSKKSYNHYSFSHDVVPFRDIPTDFELGCREGEKSCRMGESMESAHNTMLTLSTGYTEPGRFIRGFQEGYRIAKGQNGDWL